MNFVTPPPIQADNPQEFLMYDHVIVQLKAYLLLFVIIILCTMGSENKHELRHEMVFCLAVGHFLDLESYYGNFEDS